MISLGFKLLQGLWSAKKVNGSRKVSLLTIAKREAAVFRVNRWLSSKVNVDHPRCVLLNTLLNFAAILWSWLTAHVPPAGKGVSLQDVTSVPASRFLSSGHPYTHELTWTPTICENICFLHSTKDDTGNLNLKDSCSKPRENPLIWTVYLTYLMEHLLVRRTTATGECLALRLSQGWHTDLWRGSNLLDFVVWSLGLQDPLSALGRSRNLWLLRTWNLWMDSETNKMKRR